MAKHLNRHQPSLYVKGTPNVAELSSVMGVNTAQSLKLWVFSLARRETASRHESPACSPRPVATQSEQAICR